MKKYLLFLGFCFSVFSSNSQMPQSGQKKTKVLILAVFHFVSNNDAVKLKKEDMLTDQRQKEIDELNYALSKFRSDKIFIEWPPSYQRFVDSTYAEYRKGTYKVNGNEVYQIGYKLANKSGHPTLYCMDAPGKYRMDTVISTAKAFGQYENLERIYNKENEEVLSKDSLQKLLTVKGRLRQVNKKENIMASHYLNAGVTTAPYVGKVGDYAGAEFMAEWYKRNIRMYSNIIRQISTQDDAILVIVGAGHARIIQHFFEDNPSFEVVDPLRYLK